MIGRVLITAGVLLAVPQAFASRPWQAGFVLGCVLVFFGLMRLVDES